MELTWGIYKYIININLNIVNLAVKRRVNCEIFLKREGAPAESTFRESMLKTTSELKRRVAL